MIGRQPAPSRARAIHASLASAGPASDGRGDARAGSPDLALINSRDHAQAGQGLIEYGLILVVMAIACVVSLVFFGDQLSSLLSLIASAV